MSLLVNPSHKANPPNTRLVGVEPAGAANMAAALAAGHPLVRDAGCELVAVPEGIQRLAPGTTAHRFLVRGRPPPGRASDMPAPVAPSV